MYSHFWKAVLWLVTKLNIICQYDPALALSDICPKELKTDANTPNKAVYECLYSFAHICCNLELAKFFFSRQMDK